ncbi:MaoC family dehydratase N-terminal domain-containing protein [Roseibium limicola]|uniref:MaoC family dehydratase N-terminal domain-containing protein n=1 Tax=Roseibium limicola TaxID=2816037 RepID=A0A939EKC3_9HYPH|nr:MaoC family dehydratase N-terminal domain-containing protein [Roseibium limicola]MBO0344245.1 MaoC family dehydratase N-terminal domain-containing protein [Roseibium limicola]
MATGRFVSDLDKGDQLGPVDYVVSAFTVREYCHSVEITEEAFLGTDQPIAPPTLVHLDKLKLYEAACPEGTGPSARLHVEFDADFHDYIHVDTEVEVAGKVTDRFEKRGRTYVITEIDLREKATGKRLITYRDTVILAYRQAEEHGGQTQ